MLNQKRGLDLVGADYQLFRGFLLTEGVSKLNGKIIN